MRALPTTILIATDGTPTSAVALQAAGDIAKRTGAGFHVLHVWGDPYAGMPVRQSSEAEEETARGVVDRECEHAASLGFPAPRGHTAHGIRGPGIVRAAARLHADLIVVGGRQPSFLTDMLTTRVSRGVVAKTRVPVLLVPATANWPPARVIAAIEDLTDAREVAPIAAWFADTLGIGLYFIHVVPANAVNGAAETRALIESVLDYASDGELRGFEVSIVRGGSVARTLLEASRSGPGVLAMGARGIRQLLQEGRQSVAEDVTRHSYGPLLLVPERIRVSGTREVGGRAGAAEPALR